MTDRELAAHLVSTWDLKELIEYATEELANFYFNNPTTAAILIKGIENGDY